MTRSATAHIQRNTIFNLAGSLAPLLISLITVPLFLRLVGNTRYGVMAIVWVLLGYFGVFNLGLGKATANKVASLIDAPKTEVEAFFWTAFILNAIAGMIGAAILLLLGRVLFNSVLSIPAELRSEALSTLPWLAAGVPLTTVSAVFSGALEGRECFGTVNLIAAIGTILSQLMPLTVAYFLGPKLDGLIGATVLSLLLSGIISLLFCFRLVPLSGLPSFHRRMAGELFGYGGWVTITALVGPFLTSLDQMFIGARAGVQLLPFYSVPYNLVTRLSLLPGSLSRTLFPRFSMLPEEEAKAVLTKSCLVLSAFMTPAVLAGIVFLRPFLRIWIGAGMADAGGLVGEIILVGVWINSLAVIPYAFLQGQGKPKWTASFHLIELPYYIVTLWLGLQFLGLPGAALAWTLRVLLDMGLLFAASRYSIKGMLELLPSAGLILLVFLGAATIFTNPIWRISIGGGSLILAVFGAWKVTAPQIRSILFSFQKWSGLARGGVENHD